MESGTGETESSDSMYRHGLDVEIYARESMYNFYLESFKQRARIADDQLETVHCPPKSAGDDR